MTTLHGDPAVICSYCNKLQCGAEWRPVEDLQALRSRSQLSHGFCLECYWEHVIPQLQDLE